MSKLYIALAEILHRLFHGRDSRERTFLTVNEAAERMGMHPESVRRLCRNGKLPAVKVGVMWTVRAADADAYEVDGPGRPPGGNKDRVVQRPHAIDRSVIEEDERRREIIQRAWDRVCQGEQLTHKYEGPTDTLRLLTPEEREERRRRRGGG